MSGTNYTLREAVDRVLADARTSLHTSFPARVLRYDVTAQTVDVRPALQREQSSDAAGVPVVFESLPDLLGVQVMWQRAGGFAATFPIAAGDWVLVLCAEQSTALWRQSAQAPSSPGIDDPHGLNGCVAIPGWYPDRQKLTNVSPTNLVLGRADGSSVIAMKPDGDIVLGGEAAMSLAQAPKLDAIFRAVTALPRPTNPASVAAWAGGFMAAIAAAYPGGIPTELGPAPPPAAGVPSTASIGTMKVRAT